MMVNREYVRVGFVSNASEFDIRVARKNILAGMREADVNTFVLERFVNSW